jgi:hypothetical protein
MPYRTESPTTRRLRILTFDPSLATMLETSTINQITLLIPWEEKLDLGPIGEYIEVIDYDPASGVGYVPVNLNDPNLLAQDGLQPSESNPQFHQQMVYAVAMTTIQQFERALGRVAFWGDHQIRKAPGDFREQFVRRLRIYPHALRDRNAYYSPVKKAVLFGYFPATGQDSQTMPGTLVFTCLSHDIIAHEVTHALLDGVHPRFNEASNPDVHAFHEAFADIVALFQHFSYPIVLENQIRKTRGNLQSESLLGQLAQQFGQATGRGAALRDALGKTTDGKWAPRQPDPKALLNITSPHERGSILVAAIFRAFLLIYRAQTDDLFRIATGGSGTLPAGEIHPDLTLRLAREAANCAERVLQMCIRAIDYCPPVDITFGDFLRAVITADLDFRPEEESSFRIVFIESFREWGIYPKGLTSLGIETLAWPTGDILRDNQLAARIIPAVDDTTWDAPDEVENRWKEESGRKNYLKGFFSDKSTIQWNLESDRFEVWKSLDTLRQKWHKWLEGGDNYGRGYSKLFGLVVDKQQIIDGKPTTIPSTIYCNDKGEPKFEVHSVRPSVRRTSRGSIQTTYIIEVTQRRRGYFDQKEQKRKDAQVHPISATEKGDFTFRTGCTIVIDPSTQEVLRVIRTAGTISANGELERVRKFLCGELAVNGNAFDSGLALSLRLDNHALSNEPFALLHNDPS